MNIFTKKVWLCSLLSASCMMITHVLARRAFDTPLSLVSGEVFAVLLLVGVMMVFMHEKIARCDSRRAEQITRFSGYAWMVFCAPGLLSLYLFEVCEPRVIAALAAQTGLLLLVGGGVTVQVLYTIDPEGPGRYFSVSSRFNNTPN